MKDETTYGLSPEQLARLLAIGLPGSEAQDDTAAPPTPAEVLRDMLESKLTLDPAIPESLPAVLNRPCEEMLPAAGRTISDLLLDSKTDLSVIKAVKDYAKELARRGGTDAQEAAATTIYYAAIASALVFHGHKITRHSYEKLQEAYAELEQKPWGSSELKDLFRKALAICQERERKAG